MKSEKWEFLVPKFLCLYFSQIMLFFPLLLSGQVSDNIQLNASFSSAIELRIDGGSDVSWKVETVKKYEDGFWPAERPIEFSVAASTNFRIDFFNTEFKKEDGVSLDIRNLAYRLKPRNDDVKADFKKRYDWATPDGANKGGANLSGIYVAAYTPKTILIPGPQGNAGSFEKNAFIIRVGIASRNIRDITNLPPLIEQNIAPGAYKTVLTLTAYPEP